MSLFYTKEAIIPSNKQEKELNPKERDAERLLNHAAASSIT
jgi:hypothetical protein